MSLTESKGEGAPRRLVSGPPTGNPGAAARVSRQGCSQERPGCQTQVREKLK